MHRTHTNGLTLMTPSMYGSLGVLTACLMPQECQILPKGAHLPKKALILTPKIQEKSAFLSYLPTPKGAGNILENHMTALE